MTEESEIVWGDTLRHLCRVTESGALLTHAISAYAKSGSLERLLELGYEESLSVVVRWRIGDLVQGSSDLEVYEVLRELGIGLFVLPSLHSKIYAFSNSNSYIGSANLTERGLAPEGFDGANLETGAIVNMNVEDRIMLRVLVEQAVRVDDELYQRFKDAVMANMGRAKSDFEEVELPPQDMEKEFTLAELPATRSPEGVLKLSSGEAVKDGEGTKASAIEDLASYCPNIAVRPTLDGLMAGFREASFVAALLEKIIEDKSISFGAMTSWVHDNCREVPAPYRTDVKEAVERLYVWLPKAYPDLKVRVPGRRSQVMFYEPDSSN